MAISFIEIDEKNVMNLFLLSAMMTLLLYRCFAFVYDERSNN